MLLPSLVLGTAAVLATPTDGSAAAATPDLFALRVGTAETISQGTIPNAVILVEGGRIVTVGEDLPVERGIPVLDFPDAVCMPGIVASRSRIGLEGRAGTDVAPELSASYELRPGASELGRVLEQGVTTLGLYPAGGGIPGVSVAVRPTGSTAESMILAEPSYLTMYISSNESAKRLVDKGFDLVDDYMEEVEKARAKFEKEKEKEKSKSKREEMVFEPPVPDEKTLPMVRLVTGDLRATIGIGKASDYLHLMDVLDQRDYEFDYDLQVTLRDDGDIFYVADRLGEAGERLIVNPEVTLHPGTRRERNLPQELSDAGCSLAFVPSSDSVRGFEGLLADVANLIRYGLDRQVALRALTLEGAHVIGLADELGSIDAGKYANLLLFDGDPFAVETELMGVMLEGDFVAGDLAD